MGNVRSTLKKVVEEYESRTGIRKSVRQISKDIDYRFESVRQMYNNETKQFPKDLLTKLCEYFECDIADLLRFEEGESVD